MTRERADGAKQVTALAALLVKGADLLNHEIVYGSSFATDTLHLGEMVESLYQFCILWLAIEIGAGAE